MPNCIRCGEEITEVEETGPRDPRTMDRFGRSFFQLEAALHAPAVICRSCGATICKGCLPLDEVISYCPECSSEDLWNWIGDKAVM